MIPVVITSGTSVGPAAHGVSMQGATSASTKVAMSAIKAASSKAVAVAGIATAKVGIIGSVLGLIIVSSIGLVVGGEHAAIQPSDLATAEISAIALEAYQNGAEECEGLDWAILAGLGKVESHHGSLYGREIDDEGWVRPALFGPALDGSGVGGNTTVMMAGGFVGSYGLRGPFLQAIGPMQFLPGTWNGVSRDGNGDGEMDPHNIHDAARGAAAYLCDGINVDVERSIRRYNNSAVYVEEVLYWAARYRAGGGVASAEAKELVAHVESGQVCMREAALEDLVAGRIDPRLVQVLNTAAEQWSFCVGYFITNHAKCVGGGYAAGCKVSNHWEGRAADIGSVNGKLVRPGNQAALEMTNWMWNHYAGDRPQELGSPWPGYGFTDANHQDHLHVGFYAASTQSPGVPPTATPTPGSTLGSNESSQPVSISIPGFVFDGPNSYIASDGVIPGQPAAVTASAGSTSTGAAAPSLPAAISTVSLVQLPAPQQPVISHHDPDGQVGPPGSVGPSDLQAAIGAAVFGSSIQLQATEYGSVHITNRHGVTLLGPPSGTARFTSTSGAPAISISGSSGVVIRNVEVVQTGIELLNSQVTLDGIEIFDITGAAVTSQQATLQANNVSVSNVSQGFVIIGGSAQITSSSVVGTLGVAIHSSTFGEVSMRDVVLGDTGASSVVVDAGSSANIRKTLIGDVQQGAAIESWGHVSVVASAIWATPGGALAVWGGGVASHNAIADGTVWIGPAAVAGPNPVGPLSTRLGSPWVEQSGLALGPELRSTVSASAALQELEHEFEAEKVRDTKLAAQAAAGG